MIPEPGTLVEALQRQYEELSAEDRAEVDYAMALSDMVCFTLWQRSRLGLSQRQLAKRMGVSKRKIDQFENMQLRPDVKFVKSLKKALSEA